MSDDLAKLQIRVDSLEASVADKRLKDLSKSGGKAEKATDGLAKVMKRTALAAGTATGAIVALVRASGNQQKELARLAELTKTTVGELAEYGYATESAGISVEKFADINKDLQDKLGDFIATGGGEFKDFFEQVAPKVGLTAEKLAQLSGPDALIAVKKALDDANVSAAEQVFYLESLANDATLLTPLLENNGEALRNKAQRARELGIALRDVDSQALIDAAEASKEFDKAFGSTMNRVAADFAPMVETATEQLTEFMVEMNKAFDSGQVDAFVTAFVSKFDGMGADIASTLDTISEIWRQFLSSDSGGGIAYATTETIDFIIDAFKYLPENFRAIVKIAAVELASLVDYGKNYGEAFAKTIGVELAKLVEIAGIYAKELKDVLNPFDGDTFDHTEALQRASQVASEMTDGFFSEATRQAEITKQARLASIGAVLQERDVAVESFEQQIQAANSLREAYEKALEVRNSTSENEGGSSPATQEPDAFVPADPKALDGLIASLRTEEEVIQESYDRRLAIILANTEEGSRQQAELKARLDEEFATQALGEFNEDDSFEAELERINTEYEQRRELILGNTKITEEQRTALEEKLTKNRNNKLDKLETARIKMVVGASSQMFGALADLAKVAGDEQSKTYKAMFAVSKAFSIAESIMAIQTGIAKAAELGWPAMIPALASVVTTTAGVVSTIQGTNFSGAYDNGGQIPAGSVGLVGEFGPEFVSGPAQVMGRKQTMDAVRGGGGSGGTVVNFINQVPNTEVEERRSQDAEGNETIDFILTQVREELRTDIVEGGGDISNALETTYTNLSRSA